MWRIEYYTEPNGRQPVAEWLDKFNKRIRNFILDKIDLLGLHGLALLNTNMMRPLKGYERKFYEIKYSNYRIVLYHDTARQVFVLLHGFKKERQRELKEIKTAYSRLRKYFSRQ